MAKIFTYGTLQEPEVQIDTIGRTMDGKHDALSGYKKSSITIKNIVYPILIPGNEKIDGIVYDVTDEELKKLDIFETTIYRRVEVTLESGTKAWVYIK